MNKRKTAAFTLIELLVVVAIIALLVSILMPSLTKARDLAKTTLCMTKEKQMAYGMHLYLQDNNNRLIDIYRDPRKNDWRDELAEAMGLEFDYVHQHLARCPETNLGVTRTHHYAFNSRKSRINIENDLPSHELPSKVWLIGETANDLLGWDPAHYFWPHDNEQVMNVMYLDLHVETRRYESTGIYLGRWQ